MTRKLKWFGQVKGKNMDVIVKTIGEIKVKKTDGRPKNKRMEIIGKDMWVCGVDEDMVRDRKG